MKMTPTHSEGEAASAAVPPAQASHKMQWADVSVTPEASEAEEEPHDPHNETLLPTRDNSAMNRRQWSAMEREWQELRARIEQSLAKRDEVEQELQLNFKRMEEFMTEYGAEGRHVIGSFRRRVVYDQKTREAGATWLKGELDRRELQWQAEEKILEFRRRPTVSGAAGIAKAKELQSELNSLRDLDPMRPAKNSGAFKCRVCGLVGVRRGKECPNVATHPLGRPAH